MKLFGISIALFLGAFQGKTEERVSLGALKNWVVYYGQNVISKKLVTYDLIVLDPNFHGSLSPFREAGAITLGYLSLGEIRKSDPNFSKVAKEHIVLEENPNWPGTVRIDIRNEKWSSLLIEEIIPAILKRGFNGLFFDTLDTPPYLEAIDAIKYEGMGEAAIKLVRTIRERYPQLHLVANRGYMILPQIAPYIDAVVAESLLTTYSSSDGTYNWTKRVQVDQQLKFINVVRTGKYNIPILSLDYWDPKDKAGIKTIYEKERALGHIPYVSTPLLDHIILEPDARAIE